MNDSIFYNQPIFQTVILALVGALVLIIYGVQRGNTRKTSALILLQEIEHIENCMAIMRDRITYTGERALYNTSKITNDIWNSNKYIALKHLNSICYPSLNKFFILSQQIEDERLFIRKQNEANVLEMISAFHRIVSDERVSQKQECIEKALNTLYSRDDWFFRQDTRAYLISLCDEWSKIDLTMAKARLIKMSKAKSLFF